MTARCFEASAWGTSFGLLRTAACGDAEVDSWSLGSALGLVALRAEEGEGEVDALDLIESLVACRLGSDGRLSPGCVAVSWVNGTTSDKTSDKQSRAGYPGAAPGRLWAVERLPTLTDIHQQRPLSSRSGWCGGDCSLMESQAGKTKKKK